MARLRRQREAAAAGKSTADGLPAWRMTGFDDGTDGFVFGISRDLQGFHIYLVDFTILL